MRQPRRARSSAALRPIGMPRALVVREDGDRIPLGVARTDFRGRQGREVRVERIEEVWRLAEEWWREAPQARTYYRVILEGGRPLTMFRDERDGSWSEQPYSSPENAGAP